MASVDGPAGDGPSASPRWDREATEQVLFEVRDERAKQHAKYGAPDLPNGTGRYYTIAARNSKTECQLAAFDGSLCWAKVLREEVYEALEKMPEEESELREELVQLAAVAVAWIEALDRKRRSSK